MEGYVFNVDVRVERNGYEKEKLPDLIAASATCFASYRKKRKHAVTLRMKGSPSFKLLKATCVCEAGEGERCSHVSGLVFYLLDKVSFLREEQQARSQGSPTSVGRKWGVPKRHKAPDHPVSRVNFKKVK